MEEDESEGAREVATGAEQGVPEVEKDPTMTGQRRRALKILRKLAFGMNRCVAKSNGEMARQLFEQKQIAAYRGYNMFFRYIPYAILRCRQEDMEEAWKNRPEFSASPLDVLPDPEQQAPVAVDEIAEVVDEGKAPRVHMNFNQKDDYTYERIFGVVATHVSSRTFQRLVKDMVFYKVHGLHENVVLWKNDALCTC